LSAGGLEQAPSSNKMPTNAATMADCGACRQPCNSADGDGQLDIVDAG